MFVMKSSESFLFLNYRDALKKRVDECSRTSKEEGPLWLNW